MVFSACEGKSGPPARRKVSGEPAGEGTVHDPSDTFLHRTRRDMGQQVVGPPAGGVNQQQCTTGPVFFGLTGLGRMFPDSRRWGHLKTLSHKTLGGAGPMAG